ncbi:MAG: DinB family protein [Anaerolineales bacterium]|nr:DinB family protein [Anaerolineales bacterium]
MNKQDVQFLFNYNQWANARILKPAAALTTEQFLAGANFPHGSLRDTLLHTLFANWIWLRRWQGEVPTEAPRAEDFPTFEALQTYWLAEEARLMEFVAACTDEQLNQIIRYTNTKGEAFEQTLWHLMAHLVNHGTQHRSEAAAILTDFNHSPGDLDLIVYLREIKR